MDFKKAQILVIGDVMIDHYVYGSVERISPEAPVPVLIKEDENTFLGGAGLVTTNLRNLGASVDLVGVIGEDEEAPIVRKYLSDKNISDQNLIVEKGRPTTIKKRFVATLPYFQQLLRLDNERRENVKPETEQKIIENVKQKMDGSDLVVISDYNKGILTAKVIESVIALAKEKGKKILVDTKRSLYDYKGVYLIAPNTRELCLAFGLKNTNDDALILPEAVKLSKALGSIVVVKRGGKGATIADDDGTRTYPSKAEKIVNVSGAGDIFLATLAMALASGQNIDDAVKTANLGCGKAIAKRHPLVTLEDLK